MMMAYVLPVGSGLTDGNASEEEGLWPNVTVEMSVNHTIL